MNTVDVQHLRRAFRLGMTGRGHVEPNPMVGSVIVKEGQVIGEGFHAEFGGPHAEANALAACTESPAGATVYCTLEPCCHLDKKTPRCAPQLIEAKVARVVVGCVDPNPKVHGGGIAMLREAGIEVKCAAGNLEAEARQLIAPFVGRTLFHRPYVTLKWAQTADGKIAGAGGTPLQLSNKPSRQAVHELRARADAILVGINTVLKDDPVLTARGVEFSRLRTRIVLDSHLRTPPASRLAETAREMDVELYFTRDGFIAAGPERVKGLMQKGAHLISADANTAGRISIPKLLERDSMQDITHLLVEPGPTLARSFFDAGAADRVWINRSPKKANATDATNAPSLPARFVQTGEIDLEGDKLTEYLDKESDLFFSATPSADLVFAGWEEKLGN